MQLKIWQKYGCKLSSQTFECHWCQSKKFNHLATINGTNIFFPAKKICHGCQCLCNTTAVYAWHLNVIVDIGMMSPPVFAQTQPLGIFFGKFFWGSQNIWRYRKSQGAGSIGPEKHLENRMWRGSWDRDPRYPKGVPWDQILSLRFFSYKGS